MKNVPAVPSGPTKLNGPLAELLLATWNLTEVFVGVVAFQESVDQIDVSPPAALASFTDETRFPVAV